MAKTQIDQQKQFDKPTKMFFTLLYVLIFLFVVYFFSTSFGRQVVAKSFRNVSNWQVTIGIAAAIVPAYLIWI